MDNLKIIEKKIYNLDEVLDIIKQVDLLYLKRYEESNKYNCYFS